MNRTKRTFIVVGVAVLTAGLASFALYRAISRIPERRVEVASHFAVVAKHPIPVGARVTANDVKLVAWPKSSPVAGGFSSVNAVVDRGVTAAVIANEPLSEAKLAPLGSGAGLPPTIPPGMRAMSVKVNEVIGVAGFVVPGTRVDVVVTVAKNDDSMSRIVVENVQVLAAGTKVDQEQAKKGKPVPASVVTLMVTPADAERLALAATEGKVMLMLRNPLDAQPTTTPGVRMANLMAAPGATPETPAARAPARTAPRPRAAPAPAATPVEAPPKSYTVEAIRAAKRTEETIR